MTSRHHHIAVIGDGGWGTTLGVYLARRGHTVTLWGAFADNVRAMQKHRENKRFLPGIKLPARLKPTAQLDAAVAAGDILVLAVPSEYLAGVLQPLSQLPGLKSKTFLSVVKGIEQKSGRRMSEVIADALGRNVSASRLAVLSGPTIAGEVAAGIPSTAVIASSSRKLSGHLQHIFNSDRFRIYTNTDVTGVEIGGSVKNIIAIACGICDGLGFGTNTKAAIVTRGLNEMALLGQALGAKPKTFAGLAGLGDLVTTCFSPQSRNRTLGEGLGRGQSLKNLLNTMSMVAEGVPTARSVHRLSRRLNVPMPITEEVYKILYRGKAPRAAVPVLMQRQARAE